MSPCYALSTSPPVFAIQLIQRSLLRVNTFQKFLPLTAQIAKLLLFCNGTLHKPLHKTAQSIHFSACIHQHIDNSNIIHQIIGVFNASIQLLMAVKQSLILIKMQFVQWNTKLFTRLYTSLPFKTRLQVLAQDLGQYQSP